MPSYLNCVSCIFIETKRIPCVRLHHPTCHLRESKNRSWNLKSLVFMFRNYCMCIKKLTHVIILKRVGAMHDLKNRNHPYIAHLFVCYYMIVFLWWQWSQFFSYFQVLNELEDLCRSRLSSEARSALAFLRAEPDCPQIRYVTSKGEVLPSSAALMSEESDMDQQKVCWYLLNIFKSRFLIFSLI